jgi:hypothetical protein
MTAPGTPSAATRRVLAHAAGLAAFMLVPALVAVHARDSLPSGLRYGSSAADVLRTYGPADPGSFVRYAHYLLSRDAWDLGTTGCWPPGMGWINAALFTLSGETAFPGKTMALSVVLWGAALYAVFRALAVPRHPAARFLVVNSIWAFSSFRYGLLITASLYSESKALPLFVLGMAWLVSALRARSVAGYVASALALAAAAYVRAVFDSMTVVAFGLVAALALGRTAAAVLRARGRAGRPWTAGEWLASLRQPRLAAERHGLKLAAVVLGATLVVLAPWKLRNLAVLGDFTLRSCPNDFSDAWSYAPPPYQLGGDAACVARPDICAAVNARAETLPSHVAGRLVLLAIATAPRAYFAHKLAHLPDLWVGTPWHQLGTRNRAFLVEGLVSLGAGMVGLAWALRDLGRGGARALFSAVVLGVFLQQAVIFTLMHYEYRYSAPLRLFCYFLPWWTASLPAGPGGEATR